eukprot:3660216-Ditylum_brightwellii.AAC.1
MEKIDWAAFQIAWKHNAQRNSQIVKMVYGILPTNKQLFEYKKCNTGKCPLCHKTTETRNHLLQCPSETAKQWCVDMLQ